MLSSASLHPFALNLRLVTVFCIILLLSGIINKPTHGQGASNGLSFDGVDDFVELGDQFSYLTVPFTISFWMKLEGNGEYFILRSDDVTSPTSGAHSGIMFTVYDGNELTIQYGDGAGSGIGNRRAKRATVQNLEGKWHHVAGVVRSQTDMSLYLDGVDVGGAHEGNGEDIVHTQLTARIGRNTLFTPTFFKGELDEFRIWDTALSTDQIRAEMHRTLQLIQPELTAYFSFDTGEGQQVYDVSTSSIIGTLGLSSEAASDDPAWIRSLAPIGSAGCIGLRYDVAAIWPSIDENQSAGLMLHDSAFLAEEGDFIVFGHNNLEAGYTDASLSEFVDSRWNRTWCMDYSDPGPSKGGNIFIVFDAIAAGFEQNLDPNNEYRLLFRKTTEENFQIITNSEGEPLIHTVIDGSVSFIFDVRDAMLNGVLALDGEYTLGLIDQPLPVELITFSAFINDSQTVLQWETASELNNAGFEIQRSGDGVSFTQIGFVKGEGTSPNPHQYHFTDNIPVMPGTDTLFYRLKQIDFDGRFEYAHAIVLPLSKPQTTFLAQNAPNPFNPQTNIFYTIAVPGKVTLKIFDMLGREVITLIDRYHEAGFYETVFSGNQLQSGSYIYQLQTQEAVTTKVMTLLK